jgi:hypothetical protein
MPAEPVKYIGDKLVVGPLDYSFLPAVPSIPGTSVLNGPVWIGAGGPPTPLANCMIGPGLNPVSLQVTGVSNIFGVVNRSAVSNVTGLTSKTGVTLRNALSLSNSINIKNGMNNGTKVNVFTTVIVDKTCSASKFIGNITATTGLNPEMQAVRALAASKKGFDIQHPLKNDHRLRYICLEGPAAEVYLRGRLQNENVIQLPDYWKDLVDIETIGVSLTPIGHWQELFWEKIEWGSKLIIKNNSGSAVNCHYVVYGERKDTTKNIPEYKGLTPMDYPGDNKEYTINGSIISE